MRTSVPNWGVIAWALVVGIGCPHGAVESGPHQGPPKSPESSREPGDCEGTETPDHVALTSLRGANSGQERARVLEGWMRLGTRESAQALLTVTPRNAGERWLVVAGLAWSGAPEGAAHLLSALNDPSRDIRECAARGMGLSAHLNWTRPLAAIRDTTASPHHAELLAMGWLGTDWMLPELAAALSSDTPSRVEMARQALCILGTEGARVLLESSTGRGACVPPAVPTVPRPCTLPTPSPGTLDAALDAVLAGKKAPPGVAGSRWLRVMEDMQHGSDEASRMRAQRWLREGRMLHPALQRPRDGEWTRLLMDSFHSGKPLEDDQEMLSDPVKGDSRSEP